MEDDDVDCANKTNSTSSVNVTSEVPPITKEINNKIITSENNVHSPDKEESDSVTLTKLISLTNHERSDVDKDNKCQGTDRHLCSQPSDHSTSSSSNNNSSISINKVNGEIIKSESCVSEEEISGGVCTESEEILIEKKVDDSIVDNLEHCNKRKRPLSNASDDSNESGDEFDKDSSSSSPVEFRGFKKRKTSDAEKFIPIEKEEQSGCDKDFMNDVVEKPKVVELRRSARNASIAKRKMVESATETKEESEDQLTEYAQYLGLQPTVKFKCGRCGEKHFQSMASLNAHQLVCCNKSGSNALVKPTKPSGDSNLSTNFRITRKVYLCSACGTYYENWKLFLHMRDMHKRHICLFCLGMFSVADKLAEHLLFKHNVHEKTCKSPEEFLNLFKGSCYLTCCSCEKMFTEREDFFDHQCKDLSLAQTSTGSKDSTISTIKDSAQRCSLCGVKCGHFQSCPSVNINKFQNSPSTSVNNKNSSNNPNMSLTKYYIPVPASVQKGWNKFNAPVNSRGSEKDDYYDVGSAASFCHVDIAHDSDTQSSPEKKQFDHKTYSKCDNRQKNLMKSSDNKENSISQIQNSTLVPSSTTNSENYENTSVKKDNKILEINESCDNESINTHQNSDNEDVSDADDEQNSSDDNSIKPQNFEKKTDVNDILSDKECVNKKNEFAVNYTENSGSSVISCVTKLERSEEKFDEDENSVVSSNENDDIERINKEKVDESNIVSNLHEGNKIVNNNIEDNGKVIINTANDLPNSLITVNDQEMIKLDKSENMDVGNLNSEKDKVLNDDCGDDDDVLNNQALALLPEENNLEKKDKESVDRSDESEDSDKLSVVISEEGTKEDNSYSDDDDEDDDDDGTGGGVGGDDGNGDDEGGGNDDNNDDDVDEGECSENRAKEDDRLNTEQDKGIAEAKSSENISVWSENDTLEPTDNCDNDSNENGEGDDDDGDNGNHDDDNDDEDDDDDDEDEDEDDDEGGDNDALQNGSEMNNDNVKEAQNKANVSQQKEETVKSDGDKIQLASEEVMAMALTLEDKMDSLSSQSVIKECVRTSCTTCSYCSHAIKIGVNGKQLALHLLAEHRYMPVKNETVEDVIERLKKSLDELQDTWFNTDSYDSSDKSCFVPYDHTYECFQCNYVTNLHKDLYTHKRKVHQKTILYCSMCKANFYSYSELLCHMCPGVYVSKDIQFRCCFCELDRIPSAFRLMVHLRKSHHTCDICLEVAGDQQKLSTHMWKHKLHHLCYRCGIAYRNKPDITKHLFWKHGTESVLCKKCLQKKWPHVYHFCIPPTVFICEDCNLSFSKAVALKVHKRMHASDFPYSCTTCNQKFISKKLLLKHEKIHCEVPVEDNSKMDVLVACNDIQKNSNENTVLVNESPIITPQESTSNVQPESDKCSENALKPHRKKNKRDKEKKIRPVVDVYDLPPLNLSSESDDSDDEKEVKLSLQSNNKETQPLLGKEVTHEVEINPDDILREEKNRKSKSNDLSTAETGADTEDNPQPVTVVDGIWDSFHSYKAEQEKRGNLDIINKHSILSAQSDITSSSVITKDAVLGDHDYCIPNAVNEASVDESMEVDKSANREHSSSIDHDYCTLNSCEGTSLLSAENQDKTIPETPLKKKQKSPKKKVLKHHNSSSSSDSSTDSDSSSCSCGTNCSCSSSSSNSSSTSSSDSDSSSSEGRHHNSSVNKREKKKEKLKNKKKEDVTKSAEPVPVAEEPVVELPPEPEEPLIRESDLETDETSTDEEFYDQYPQRHANQMLAEKKNQLMVLAAVAPVNNGTASTVPSSNSPPLAASNSPVQVMPPVTPNLPATISNNNSSTTITMHSQSKKRIKSKKRKKSSQLDNSNSHVARMQNMGYESSQPSTSFSTSLSKQIVTDLNYHSTTQSSVAIRSPNQNLIDNSNIFIPNQPLQLQQQHQISDSHSKRLSKRRRIRNKFYGYSSEEDDEHSHHPPPAKWKKTEVNSQHGLLQHQLQHPPQSVLPPEYSFQPKIPQQSIRGMEDNRITLNINEGSTKRVSSSESSSNSEMDSESETDGPAVNPPVVNSAAGAIATEKDDKLYCYCQCPYDEVSEMIACDGVDCAIEWFHFECVGIMVPPKGKWYCPDCRKRRGLS